jgi:hypothetical protein
MVVAKPNKTHVLFSLKDSGQAIPLVVESCIRYINLYGKLNFGSSVFGSLQNRCWTVLVGDEILFILEDFLSQLCFQGGNALGDKLLF